MPEEGIRRQEFVVYKLGRSSVYVCWSNNYMFVLVTSLALLWLDSWKELLKSVDFGSLDICLCTFSLKEGRNLVDSASSHTLVSKIKPCMSKYKSYTLKLRMAHYISYSLFDSPLLLG